MQKGFAPIIFVLGGILLLGIVVGGVYLYQSRFQAKPVNSFEECVKAGNPVLESYPRQCKSGGKSFTEELSEEEKKKLVPPKGDGQVCIQIITPAKNLKTGECKEFPTPCDVPEGWEKVGSCAVSPSEETTNWKMYKTDKFEFKYPPDIFIKEQEKGFYVFLAGPNVPAQNSDMGIDARFLNGNDQFDTAVDNVKKNLINTKVEKIENGVLISGTVGPGYAEGAKVLEALFFYQKGAISFSYTSYSGDLKKESLYRKMLSTFKVVYSK